MRANVVDGIIVFVCFAIVALIGIFMSWVHDRILEMRESHMCVERKRCTMIRVVKSVIRKPSGVYYTGLPLRLFNEEGKDYLCINYDNEDMKFLFELSRIKDAINEYEGGKDGRNDKE